MKAHTKTMEAPLYQSFQVYIVNKVRAKIEIHLGISGEKIEIDPVQQKNSKFTLVKQKAVSHHMDSVAWCDVTDIKGTRALFRIVYSSSSSNMNSTSDVQLLSKKRCYLQRVFDLLTIVGGTLVNTSASFKHYDFEADQSTAKEIVQKINLILKLRSSSSRKEYIAAKERKQKKKNVQLNM